VIAVLLNLTAGGSKTSDLPRKLEVMFAGAGAAANVIVLESPGQTPDAVRQALDAGATVVVAGGGDGTVSSVARELAGTQVALGVLPLGTLNHFAKDLGLTLDLEKAVDVIANGVRTPVDVGVLNGRAFINNSSIGIYPDIVVEREALRGRGHRKLVAFLIATGRVLRKFPGVVVRISGGGASETFRTPFLFVANNEYQLEGIRLGRRSRLDEGRLYAYVAPRTHARDLPKLAVSALLGRAAGTPSLRAFAATELEVDIRGRRMLRVALDGEVFYMPLPLRYRIRHGALEVMTAARGTE